VALLGVLWFCNLAVPKFSDTILEIGGPVHQGSLQHAEGVLAEAALDEFQQELPHWWQRLGDYFLRPVALLLPKRLRSSPWSFPFFRATEKLLRGNGLVKSEGGHSFRNLRAWLEEVCRVLGLSQTRKSSSRCPQLWIDEAWPPSRLTPRSKRSAPIWILPATEQNALVVQMSLLKEYRPQEIKALMGFEVGQLVLRRLPGVIPQELREPLTYGIFAARAYDALCRVTEPNQALAGAPPWIRRMLTGRARSWKRPYSHTGTTAEFEALGVILRRLVPGPLLPPIFAGLAVNSNEIAEALEHRKPPKWQLRGSPAPQPLRDLAGNALVLALIRLFSGSRGRSYVLTLDRAAALAAGDATAAASALLRVHRLLPPQQTDLRRTLGSVADMAHERIWAYRQEALFQNPREPPPAVRVAELLSWSQTDQAKRLIALAEMRRKHIETSSWKTWAPGRPWPWGSFSSAFWKPWMGYWALSILWLPFALTSIDAVRWASWVTLCLTVFGLLLPLLQFIGAPTLPFMSISTLWTSLLLYSLIAGSIWWNHLLGGARRWAVLSGQLAAQLVDQADAATGIAFLTRDWAEMARRSLAALDQELCGSWRTSLHELASKLADLRQELEDSTPLSNGNGVQKTLKDGDHSDEAEDDQGGHRQLAAWAGRMEAAVGRPTARQPLWLKVDRAVQRAARIELGRMRTALEVSDPDQLQAMMTWWMARDASAASSGGMATARLLQEDSAREEGEETLGALLFSERLHRRFPYTSFYGRDDYAVGGTPSEASQPGAEFERLQQALQQNLEALQDLRSKLAPYQDVSRNSGLLWRWADVVAVASRFREALRLPSKAQRALAVVPAAAATRNGMALTRRFSEVDFSDNIAEFTTICGLFLAAVIGLLGFCAAALWHNYGWAAGLFAFGAANSVLLRNYSRLHLPHIRRRLEHRLKELSQQKDSLIRDVQQVQHASRKTGMVQVRAHIFLQSVNVIRNIDYLTRCIKTEVQRLASDRNPRKAQLRRRLASSGMQLLLALLPHSPPQWQQEALGGENCAELASLLYARRRGLAPLVASEVLSSGYMESRKRLWLLFRMVHLSSAIPTEVQGKLTALVDSYLRPVLVERRVPTGYCQVLGNPSNSSHAMLEDSKREGGEDLGEDAQRHGSVKGASVSSARSVESEDQTAESEDTFSFCASTASQSKISSASCDRMGDTSKAVRKLFATRSDIMQVLKRLPAPSLMSPAGSTTQTDNILREIFTSVAVGVTANGQPGQGQAGAVGLAIGYQYGERPYNLSGRVQTTLELKVALPQTNQAGSSSSAGGSSLEVKVQLCDLSDSEPSAVEALSAWSDLAAALPLRFNDSALRVRRRHLKKAKEALRSLPKG